MCDCPKGYEERDRLCKDKDECADPTLNDCMQRCENTVGGYLCRCWAGYKERSGHCRLTYIPDLETKFTTFMVSVKITSQEWQENLLNPNSEVYRQVAAQVIGNVSQELSSAGIGFREIQVSSFRAENSDDRKGSVIADMLVVQDPNEKSLPAMEILEKAVKRGNIGSLLMDPTFFVTKNGVGYIKGIKMYKPDNYMILGNHVTVSCLVSAVSMDGAMDIRWKINGRWVKPLLNSRIQTTELNRDSYDPSLYTSNLIINGIKKVDTEGKVECVAVVGQTSVSNETTLHIYTVEMTAPPSAVLRGSQATISCTITPTPPVPDVLTIVWCQNGGTLSSSTHNEYQISADSSFKETINIMSARHSEAYSCGVRYTKSGDRNCSQTVQLNVYNSKNLLCPKEEKDGIVWDWVYASLSAYRPCPEGYLGMMERKCGPNGVWEDIDFSMCIKSDLVSIFVEVSQVRDGYDTNNISGILKDFSQQTAEITSNENITSGDLGTSVEIITKVAAISAGREDLVTDSDTQDFLLSVNNVLKEGIKPVWDNLQIKRGQNKAAELMNAVHQFGNSVTKRLPKGETKTLAQQNIVVEYKKSALEDIAFPVSKISVNSDYKGAIQLKESTLKKILSENNTVDYAATYYKTLSDLFPRKPSQNSNLINTDIISFSLANGETENLEPPLKLEFLLHKDIGEENAICSFWDFDESAWSDRGCYTVFKNSTWVTCQCNHMTNFAVLMSSVEASESENYILGLISIVGCTISIAGLLATAVCHLIFWRYVKSDKTKILLNLCLSLTIAMTIFLLGVEQTQHKILCTAIAILLQYFFLVSFFLMLAEGITIAVSVILVFWTNSKVKVLLPLAWGIPMVIVAVSMVATGLEGYGNNKFCWLTIEEGVIYAFVVPAALIIVINLIITAIVLRALFSTRAVMSKSQQDKIRAGVRSVAVLAPILGISWIFGVLSVNSSTIIFQYLFTIFNSLQGFFIFLFHCVLNRAIVDAIRRKCNCMRSMDDSSKHKHKSETSNKFSTANPLSNGTRSSQLSNSSSEYSNGGNKNGHQYTNKAYTADQNLDTAFTKTSAVDEKTIDLSVSPNLSERKDKSPMGSPTGSVKSDLLFVQWADEHKRSIAFNPSPIGSIRSSKVPYSAPFK